MEDKNTPNGLGKQRLKERNQMLTFKALNQEEELEKRSCLCSKSMKITSLESLEGMEDDEEIKSPFTIKRSQGREERESG